MGIHTYQRLRQLSTLLLQETNVNWCISFYWWKFHRLKTTNSLYDVWSENTTKMTILLILIWRRPLFGSVMEKIWWQILDCANLRSLFTYYYFRTPNSGASSLQYLVHVFRWCLRKIIIYSILTLFFNPINEGCYVVGNISEPNFSCIVIT